MHSVKSLLVLQSIAVTLAIGVDAQTGAQDWKQYSVPAAPAPQGDWVLDESLSDEFNYDLSTPEGKARFDAKWNTRKPDNWFGPGATYFSQDHYVVAEGVLKIFGSRVPKDDQIASGDEGFTRTTYTSYITSKALLTPGCYTEVMLKGTGTTMSSNFWMIDDKNETEIDVVEVYGDGDWYPRHPATAVHFQRRGGNGDEHKQIRHPKDGIRYGLEFHRYGVHWIDEMHVQFYYDGEPVRAIDLPKEIVDPSGRYLNQPVRLIFDLEAHAWRGVSDIPGDADLLDKDKNNMQVDWVRTYRTTSPSRAASTAPQRTNTLYAEDFSTDPGYVGAIGPDNNNISSVSFGKAGPSDPNVKPIPNIKPGQYAGTSQYLAGTVIVGSTKDGKFAIGSDKPVYDKSRSRSYMTFIDTSLAVVGQYNISFDVSDFQSADENTSLYLHLFEGTDTDKGHLVFQVTHQDMLPKLTPTLPGIQGRGAKIARLLVDNEIKGNGRFSLNFGLSEAGRAGDFLALAWSQVKGKGGAVMPSVTIDNVDVSLLPEPASVESASNEIPLAPHGQTGEWTLLTDVSDEFDGRTINPRKWNNNPASWGAWTWDERNTAQGYGKLHIRMVHEPHLRNTVRMFYKSGILRSHKQMTYGYYEARIKGCKLFPGACPAFWAYSDGKQFTGEVRYCEVDFVELFMNELNDETNKRDPVNHIDMNLHLRLADGDGKERWVRPKMNPDLCAHSWLVPWDPRDDFHVYGCDVTPEMITWYIDGKEAASEANKYWHLPMNITLSLGLRHPHIGWVGQDIKPVPQAATAEGFPTMMEVDYVRVWERR
jgi:beta-glucanase (GH16 family)